MPKVSVIIPVYNTEKYLRKCLDSVCGQTLSDIEIICINDCSTDGSLAILEEYAQRDARVKVIKQQQNKGAASARNSGIDVASGEYIGFVDSDDLIDLDFYQKLYEKAIEANSDMTMSVITITDYKNRTFISPEANMVKENGNKFFAYSYFTPFIYSLPMIQKNKIRFTEDAILCEDMLFLGQAIISTNKIEVVFGSYYYYMRRENSGFSQELTQEQIDSAIPVLYSISNLFLSCEINDGLDYAYMCILNILSQFMLMTSPSSTKKCLKAFYNIYLNYPNREKLNISPQMKNFVDLPQENGLLRALAFIRASKILQNKQ